MNLKEFIDRGVLITGGQKQLGELLSVSSQQLTDAKRGRAGLPPAACGLLAEILNEDETVILAASELLTEKHPRRRAYWEKKLERLAACVLLGVISVVTPTPSEAAPLLQVIDSTLYIMSNSVLFAISLFL